ncbi:serine protease [Cyclospora cayetanensis]|uniref:Serine protease n=1 Tax=Cyclospora cayetanensis TaxID=88456 RepID=A0A1D3CYI3_9EIME|nr:serine protease [Cyclospora cayetanensis]
MRQKMHYWKHLSHIGSRMLVARVLLLLLATAAALAPAFQVEAAGAERAEEEHPRDESVEPTIVWPSDVHLQVPSSPSIRRTPSVTPVLAAALLLALAVAVASGAAFYFLKKPLAPEPLRPPLPLEDEEALRAKASRVQLPEGVDKTSAGRLFGAFLDLNDVESKPNAVLSPLSILSVLSIAAEGASGPDAQAVRDLLSDPTVYRLPEALEGWPHAERLKSIKRYLKDEAPVIDMLAEVYVDKGLEGAPGLDAFTQRINMLLGYPALQTVPFTEEQADLLNERVSKLTRGKLTELLPASAITQSRLLLLNAVYFKAGWRTPFAPEDTKKDIFKALTKDGVKEKQTDFMHGMLEAGSYRKCTVGSVQVLELPYNYPGASMYIYVPSDIKEFEVQLREDPSLLSNLVDQSRGADGAQSSEGLSSASLELALPKFHLEAGANKTEVLKVLRKLGITSFLEQPGTVDGIAEGVGLRVQAIQHQADLQVDEEGTEAAAATFATVPDGPMPRVESTSMKIDTPFLFEIRLQQGTEAAHDLVLFAGRFADPDAE